MLRQMIPAVALVFSAMLVLWTVVDRAERESPMATLPFTHFDR